MLKKKNIAMVMAAATVATSAMPVFADLNEETVDKSNLISEVEKKLALKYADERLGSVYEVRVTIAGGIVTDREVKTVDELKVLIEKAEVEKQALSVLVTDKGHKTVDGKVVNTIEAKSYGTDGITNFPSTTNTVITKVTANPTDKNVTLDLASGVQVVIDEHTALLDLNTGLDKDGNEITISDVKDEKTAKKVVAFKVKSLGLNEFGTARLPLTKETKLNCGIEGFKSSNYNLTDFVTENGYTQAAKELIELLGDANGDAVDTKIAKVVKDGKERFVYFDQGASGANVLIERVSDAEYKMTIKLKVAGSLTDVKALGAENVQLVIKSNNHKALGDLKDAIVKATKTTEVTVGKHGKLAGETRFDTAVEISKAGFEKKSNKVVLVGENAVVDGLASAPLAKVAKAPILLTKKDSVPASTMAEIKRLTEKGDTIYLIGGKNTISKEVEAQLIKEMNAKIVRIAGSDRHDTSLEIADRLQTEIEAKYGSSYAVGTHAPKKAFVVGGEGLSDAMSVAAVAAREEDPIIVTPADGLTKGAKAYLKDSAQIVAVDVVGGETKVSTSVLEDAKAAKSGNTVVRVSGIDRNDTNAKVIAKYFVDGSTKKLANAYVAKDADSQLVDALAAAPLAGSNEGAVVLATNDLTRPQSLAIDATKVDNIKKAIQVGEGVSATVMQKVLKALGL